MPWIRRLLRGNPVYVRVDANGNPVAAADGRVDVAYKALPGAKLYRASIRNLDPTGEHPDVLPINQVVEVTGMFDHPAASSCTRTDFDSEPVPSQGCRLEFAVTQLLVSGP